MKDADKRFPFRCETQGDVTVLHCGATHYHADSFAPLGRALSAAAEQAGPGGLVIDLSGVVLFSSTALRALRAAHLAREKQGRRIMAAGGGELVSGVLKFAPFIPYYQSLEEAVAAAGQEAAG